jgi:hypothetical protein
MHAAERISRVIAFMVHVQLSEDCHHNYPDSYLTVMRNDCVLKLDIPEDQPSVFDWQELSNKFP